MKTCDHKLFSTNEEWIADDEVKITMKCSLCNNIFEGVLKYNEQSS